MEPHNQTRLKWISLWSILFFLAIACHQNIEALQSSYMEMTTSFLRGKSEPSNDEGDTIRMIQSRLQKNLPRTLFRRDESNSTSFSSSLQTSSFFSQTSLGVSSTGGFSSDSGTDFSSILATSASGGSSDFSQTTAESYSSSVSSFDGGVTSSSSFSSSPTSTSSGPTSTSFSSTASPTASSTTSSADGTTSSDSSSSSSDTASSTSSSSSGSSTSNSSSSTSSTTSSNESTSSGDSSSSETNPTTSNSASAYPTTSNAETTASAQPSMATGESRTSSSDSSGLSAQNKRVVIGVVVGVGAPLLISLAVLAFFYYKKRSANDSVHEKQSSGYVDSSGEYVEGGEEGGIFSRLNPFKKPPPPGGNESMSQLGRLSDEETRGPFHTYRGRINQGANF